MSAFISKVSTRQTDTDRFLDNRPFPLVGAGVAFVAFMNVASAAAMLLSI